jgi:hypothetical protein
MTGWAGPGTNLPLSVITAGSLADIGYTVNYAAADTYIRSLSSSALASISSARSGSASLLASNSAINFSTNWAVNGNSTELPRRQSQTPDYVATPFNASAVDLLMADSRHELSRTIASERTHWTASREQHDAYELAWDLLDSLWNTWPVLAPTLA